MRLCVTPHHFAEHLAILKQRYSIISLSTLVEQIRDGSLSSRSVVVTFDDGYADNLYFAKPIIEKFEAKSTVFVVTGRVDNLRGFWWDELTRVFLDAEDLPNELTLKLLGNTYRWQFVDPSTMNGNGVSRNQAYLDVAELIWRMEPEPREQIVSELTEWAGITSTRRREHSILDVGELQLLSNDGLVEIGAHTVNHPVLSTLPNAMQSTEIMRSKLHLEEWLDRPILAFSYPHGGPEDFNQDTVALVKHAGFSCACANWPSPVNGTEDIFQLPRFIVRDWDGSEFERRITGWFQ